MNEIQIKIKKIIDYMSTKADSSQFSTYDADEFGIEAQGIIYNIEKNESIIVTGKKGGKLEIEIKKISEMKPLGSACEKLIGA